MKKLIYQRSRPHEREHMISIAGHYIIIKHTLTFILEVFSTKATML